MDYEVITVDGGTGKDVKLVSTDEIRSYFASLEEGKQDDEIEIIIRAANQSLLADPLAMLTGEGDGKLVHSGSFHSTVIATVCSFKLDLRHEGERHIKVNCELAICVPSGLEPDNNGIDDSDENEDKVSATLELARANLLIQFSPSPTSTPSGKKSCTIFAHSFPSAKIFSKMYLLRSIGKVLLGRHQTNTWWLRGR